MRLDKLLAETIIELIDAQTHKLLGAIQDGRVVLGGSAGSAGGTGDPPIGFWGQLRQGNVTYDTDAATRACAAGSAGSDSLVDNLDRIRLGWEICADAITEDHIDWGHGAGQVSAVDIPFQSTSGSIDATNVRDAIEETYAEGGGGSVLGDHTHSGPGSGGSTLASHVVTGDLVLDDDVGDSPRLQFVGGTNDDAARIWLSDSPTSQQSDLIIGLPGNTDESHLEVQALSGAIGLSVDGEGNIGVGVQEPTILPGCGLTGRVLDVDGAIQSTHNASSGSAGLIFGSGNNSYMLPLFFGVSESDGRGMWFLIEPEDGRVGYTTAAALVFEGRKRDNTALTSGDLVHFHNGGVAKVTIDVDGNTTVNMLYTGRISTQTVIVGEGCEYDTLGGAVAAVNSFGPPTADSRWDILVLGDTTESGGSVGIPQYCDVFGIGDPVIDMGANVIEMAPDSGMQDIIVEGSASHVVGGNGVTNIELRNVRAIGQPSGLYSFHFRGASTVRFLNCIAETTSSGSDSYGFYFRGTTQATLINCVADDVNGFDTALGLDDTTTVTTLGGRFVASDDDVWVASGATWNHLASGADPNNITILGSSAALPQADPRLPAGAIILWDNSDSAPAGYTRVSGADDRYLYAVASGAGGTGGNATHSHTLTDTDWPNTTAVSSILLSSNYFQTQSAGASTLPFPHPTTDSQNTDPPLYKVLVCEKD